MICPREKCRHYSVVTKYPRKCYYGPQCWRGKLDTLFMAIRLRLKRK